jgi:glycosyltransferase involved in cell wall biosynthesis
MTRRRLRICVALPGINHVPQSPYVLSTLPVVRQLRQHADVVVVYRGVSDPTGLDGPFLTIDGQRDGASGADPYHHPANHVRYALSRRDVERFVRHRLGPVDLVCEKEWSELGMFSAAARRRGVPTVHLAEAVYDYDAKRTAKARSGSPAAGALRAAAGIGYRSARTSRRRRWSRRAAALITETPELSRVLAERGFTRRGQLVEAVPYGVDERVFRPTDRLEARRALGLAPEALLIVFVGSLNRFIQEPGPLVEAMRHARPGAELHLVGDGGARGELEMLAAASGDRVTFHGRQPQARAAQFMAAADLCAAPYDTTVFAGGEFTCASLKIPEYLATGRPVVSTDTSVTRRLLQDGCYGYLLPNDVASLARFVADPPSISDLREKERRLAADKATGLVAERGIVLTWAQVADRYLGVIDRVLGHTRSGSMA